MFQTSAPPSPPLKRNRYNVHRKVTDSKAGQRGDPPDRIKRYARVDEAGDMARDSNCVARELNQVWKTLNLILIYLEIYVLAKEVNLVAYNVCKLDDRIRRYLE